MALDPTPGGAASNSYVSLEEIKDYLAERYPVVDLQGSLSNGEFDTLLEKGAKRITLDLDYLFDWLGEKTFDGQRLDHPRTGLVGVEDPNVLADEIKLASLEGIVLLLSGQADARAISQIEELGINKVKIDVLEFGFSTGVKNKDSKEISTWEGSSDRYLKFPFGARMFIPESWYVTGRFESSNNQLIVRGF